MGEMIIGRNLLTYTINSVTSQDANWPAANLLIFDKRIRFWKTTVATDSSVVIDLGSAKALKAVGVIDVNYTSCKIQGSTISNFDPPPTISVTQSIFNSDATAHAVNMPGGVNAGDRLVCLFANDDDSTVTTPSGWTLLGTALNTTTQRLSIYKKIADGTEGPGTPVDFVTSAAQQAVAQVYRITDVSDIEISSFVTGATLNPDPPSLNPIGWGVENTLWLAVEANDSGNAPVGFPANYTDGFSATSSGGVTSDRASLSSARRINAVASEDPGTFTLPASSGWIAATIAVRPAPPPFDSGLVTIAQEKLTHLYRLHFIALTGFNYRYLRLFIPTQTTTDGASVFRTGVLAASVDSEAFLYGIDPGLRMVRNQAISVEEMHGGGQEKALNGAPYASISFDLTRLRMSPEFTQLADQIVSIGETELVMFSPADELIEDTNIGQYVFIVRKQSPPEIVINKGIDQMSVDFREAI